MYYYLSEELSYIIWLLLDCLTFRNFKWNNLRAILSLKKLITRRVTKQNKQYGKSLYKFKMFILTGYIQQIARL